jgi:hypothetical protein
MWARSAPCGKRWASRELDNRRSADVLSAFVFTVVHDMFISDIWFSAIAMMAAGAVCGSCIAGSYALIAGAHSLGSWLRYNLAYLSMFVLLGVASVLVFRPRRAHLPHLRSTSRPARAQRLGAGTGGGPHGSGYLIAELFGLIFILDVV